jgi:hypothetical protein
VGVTAPAAGVRAFLFLSVSDRRRIDATQAPSWRFPLGQFHSNSCSGRADP